MRGLLVAVVAALVLGALPSLAAASARPRDLVLRLPDVGPGYLVGDDGGCRSEFGSEGTPPALVEFDRRHAFRTCDVELNRVWRPSGAHTPEQVLSAAFVFTEDAGATAGLQAAPDLLAYTTGSSAASFARQTPTRPLGDDAAVFETPDALAGGRPDRPGVAVVWRTGSVLSIVWAAGLGGAPGVTRAMTLAERQQARIARPTPLRPGDNDDLEVPLDDPRLAGLVRWLGRSFDPPGRLGRITLGSVHGDDGPGWAARLEYGPTVTLDVWRPRAFARHSRTRFGRLVWRSPCAISTTAPVRGGRAVIYSGYGPPGRDRLPGPELGDRPLRPDPGVESGPCPARPRDRVLAHVFLRRVVVAINAPACFSCIAVPRRDPYNSIAGIRAVIRALRPR